MSTIYENETYEVRLRLDCMYDVVSEIEWEAFEVGPVFDLERYVSYCNELLNAFRLGEESYNKVMRIKVKLLNAINRIAEYDN